MVPTRCPLPSESPRRSTLDDGSEGGPVEEAPGRVPQELRLLKVHAAIPVVAEASPPASCGQARAGEVAVGGPDPVGDGVGFELGQCPREVECELSHRCGGVDRLRQAGELDAGAGQAPDGPLEGQHASGQAVELPHHQHVEGC